MLGKGVLMLGKGVLVLVLVLGVLVTLSFLALKRVTGATFDSTEGSRSGYTPPWQRRRRLRARSMGRL
jgi:hypothetical protein